MPPSPSANTSPPETLTSEDTSSVSFEDRKQTNDAVHRGKHSDSAHVSYPRTGSLIPSLVFHTDNSQLMADRCCATRNAVFILRVVLFLVQTSHHALFLALLANSGPTIPRCADSPVTSRLFLALLANSGPIIPRQLSHHATCHIVSLFVRRETSHQELASLSVCSPCRSSEFVLLDRICLPLDQSPIPILDAFVRCRSNL